MRMRHKKWSGPELAACPYFVERPWEQWNAWHEVFEQDQPLWLELGCGKGIFLAEWALARPDVNFLGIDMISDILAVARRNIEARYQEEGREDRNIRLAPWDISRIRDILGPEDTVERIFINFCNPWDKPKQYKKRLTHTRQLEQYRDFLAPGGEIWFKTDHDGLFQHSLGYFRECGFSIQEETWDLLRSGFSPNYPTEHERMYAAQGVPIKFCIARRES